MDKACYCSKLKWAECTCIFHIKSLNSLDSPFAIAHSFLSFFSFVEHGSLHSVFQ